MAAVHRDRRDSINLIQQFETTAIAAAATVEHVPRDSALIARSIGTNFADAKRIAIADPLCLPANLFADCSQLTGIVQPRTKTEWANIDLGITEAFAGVARTGSVCVAVDSAYTGYASLLGRVHVAIVAAENIVERPADLFRPDSPQFGAANQSFVFVTGPSATADMGPLVRGVHGPHRLHIMILD